MFMSHENSGFEILHEISTREMGWKSINIMHRWRTHIFRIKVLLVFDLKNFNNSSSTDHLCKLDDFGNTKGIKFHQI